MRLARSGVHETSAQSDDLVEPQTAFTQGPGSAEITELHFATVMEAMPGFL